MTAPRRLALEIAGRAKQTTPAVRTWTVAEITAAGVSLDGGPTGVTDAYGVVAGDRVIVTTDGVPAVVGLAQSLRELVTITAPAWTQVAGYDPLYVARSGRLVTLVGLLANAAPWAGGAIATIPAGFRPSGAVLFISPGPVAVTFGIIAAGTLTVAPVAVPVAQAPFAAVWSV